MSSAIDLERFVLAQDARAPGGTTYDGALAELRTGRKRSHWFWFVFPQVEGLGASFMAQKYAIGSLEEAQAYLAHPVLGPRLREAVAAVNGLADRTAHEVFGSPDDLKFRSSLTLFAEAADDDTEFRAALQRYYGGDPDPATLKILGR